MDKVAEPLVSGMTALYRGDSVAIVSEPGEAGGFSSQYGVARLNKDGTFKAGRAGGVFPVDATELQNTCAKYQKAAGEQCEQDARRLLVYAHNFVSSAAGRIQAARVALKHLETSRALKYDTDKAWGDDVRAALTMEKEAEAELAEQEKREPAEQEEREEQEEPAKQEREEQEEETRGGALVPVTRVSRRFPAPLVAGGAVAVMAAAGLFFGIRRHKDND